MTNPTDQSALPVEDDGLAPVEASSAAKAREYLALAERQIASGFSANATPFATIAVGYALLAGVEARGSGPGVVLSMPGELSAEQLAAFGAAVEASEAASGGDGGPRSARRGKPGARSGEALRG
ncbi:hypothetical protein [Amycolatopsis sp. NPDC004378]